MNTELLAQKLYSYLKNDCCLSNEQLGKVVQSSRVELILKNQLMDNSEVLFDFNTIENEDASKYNAYIIEIRKLIDKCDALGIKIVFLKGFFLGAQLYENPMVRRGRDVDVLIDIKDYFLIQEILLGFGYTIRGGSLSKEDYIDKLSENHAVYDKFVDSVWCTFEVHTSILNPSYIYNDCTIEFFESSKKYNLLGMTPYCLNLEHNIVFLIMHYYKHFAKRFHYMMFDGEVSAKLFNLHDLAILLTKESDHIKWDKVQKICDNMKNYRFVLYTINCLKEIYRNDFFPVSFIEYLKDNSINSFVNITYQHGMGKFMWLCEELMARSAICLKDFVISKIPHNSKQFLRFGVQNLSSSVPIILSNRKEIDKVKLEIESEISADSISIHYHVRNKLLAPLLIDEIRPINRKPKNNNELGNLSLPIILPEERDGIEILLVQDDSIWHRGFSLIENEQGELSLYSFSKEKKDSIILNEDASVMYSIRRINEIEYYIDISFPFYIFGIDILSEPFLLNVSGNIANNNTGKYMGAVLLFEKNNLLWDFRGIPCFNENVVTG